MVVRSVIKIIVTTHQWRIAPHRSVDGVVLDEHMTLEQVVRAEISDLVPWVQDRLRLPPAPCEFEVDRFFMQVSDYPPTSQDFTFATQA